MEINYILSKSTTNILGVGVVPQSEAQEGWRGKEVVSVILISKTSAIENHFVKDSGDHQNIWNHLKHSKKNDI